MKKIVTKTKIRIPFYDVDPMQVVWHGNYVKYLEVARCDFFRKLRYTYDDMKNDGIMYPIAKMDMKYIKSAKFDEEIVVECILQELEPAIIIKYNIYLNNEKIFKANTMQIGVNFKTGETLYNAPKKLVKAVEEYNG